MSGSLRTAVSKPESKRHYTRHVFAKIANRYDLANVLLSFNQDRRWKRRMMGRAGIQPRERVLDLACGTGDLALQPAREGAHVVGLDITPRMVELAVEKAARLPPAEIGRRTADAGTRTTGSVAFLVGDMMALPFPDRAFDVVTTGYGLRNVPDLAGALAEIHRVLKPGGRFFSLDFDRPRNGVIRAAYLAYLSVAGSALGWVLHRDADTYRYIPETIRTYAGAPGVVSLLRRTGFQHATYEPVFGGFMAMHVARK